MGGKRGMVKVQAGALANAWHGQSPFLQDHRQCRVGAHPAYSRHMPSGRVGVLFGFFSGPGGRASSEDTCPMGGWADGFLDRAPVGVARFLKLYYRETRNWLRLNVLLCLSIRSHSSACFQHAAIDCCNFSSKDLRLVGTTMSMS